MNILDEILPEAAPSTSWIAATWISSACTCFTVAARSLSHAPSRVLFAALLSRRRKTTGVRSDHTVMLTRASSKHYPDPLRRVRYYDLEQNRSSSS